MIFLKRPNAPNCLTQTTKNTKKFGAVQNQVYWGLLYWSKSTNPLLSNAFKWATLNKQKVNNLIIDDLKRMTQNHCSFCDFYQLNQSGPTIEHFKPKSLFPKESYFWENLFYCCNRCQNSKLEQFDPYLLKPDDLAYHFNKYFVNSYDGEAILIKPNPRASDVERSQAKITIDIYGLNSHERPEARYTELLKYQNQVNQNININDWSFRFLFI